MASTVPPAAHPQPVRVLFFEEQQHPATAMCFNYKKYLSMVRVKCGFDSGFFAAFKKKLASKNTFQKHGILIFDEIHVRKEMRVNATTMSYTGHADFGETERKFQKHAGDKQAYDLTIDFGLDNYNLSFPCHQHKVDIMAQVLHYYVGVQMRQYCKQLKKNESNISKAAEAFEASPPQSTATRIPKLATDSNLPKACVQQSKSQGSYFSTSCIVTGCPCYSLVIACISGGHSVGALR
ncbi:hypothetical protein HPB50_020825 [Hyalomma asiaticum]|uniref:Uncharacterized protein n=1 Tax=Hyalomma asiaticum TaxID=266040 RepID=A0ACB7SB44_HYAAI|nr:hypothetical protein HPB50_020825 [Hyalomma asiaticum]